MDTPKNELELVIVEQNLDKNKIEVLVNSFGEFFQEAKFIANESKELIVTDETQIDLMQLAKEKRKRLQRIRLDTETIKTELKAQALRENRAIDGIVNIIKAIVIPAEEHLEKQEKFAELKQKARIAERNAERISKLARYVEDVSIYNISAMTDEGFEKLLDLSKQAYEMEQEAERQAEAERMENAKKLELLRVRQIELAPYKDFINYLDLYINTTEEEYKDLFSTGKKLKNEFIENQEKIKTDNERLLKEKAEQAKKIAKDKDIQDKKLQAERKARLDLEKKLQKEKEEQEARDKKIKEELEAKERQAEQEKLQALLASDTEKILAFAKAINELDIPAVKDVKCQQILQGANEQLEFTVMFLTKEVDKLKEIK